MSLITFFQSINFYQTHILIIASTLILLTTAVLNYFEKRLFETTQQQLEKKGPLYSDALLVAIHKPLRALIWVNGFALIGKLITLKALFLQWNWIAVFRDSSAIILFTWFLLRLTNQLEKKHLQKEQLHTDLLDRTTIQAIAQIVRVIIVLIALLIICKYFFEMPLTGLWAMGGAGSFVIGWAAKDLLANFFGALMIFLDRPFSIGDWIRSPDRQIEGSIEYIGWRLTQIRTFDKRLLYIPNSIFATICIENATQMHCWRLRETVGIRYQDCSKLELITEDIRKMLKAHPHVNTNQIFAANLISLGAYSLDILVYCFTDTRSWVTFLGIKQEIMLAVANIIQSHGAEIAFPTQTIELQKNYLSPGT